MALTIGSEAPKPTAVPPYVPFRSFRNFLDSLKQGIPARIDRSVMSSYSGALQSQLATALRYMGLTTELGHPTSLLTSLVHSEGPQRTAAMKAVLTKCYPFLFDSFDLKSATPRMMEEQFAEQGASGGTLDKCMLFFIAAARDAGIELSPHMRVQRGPRAARSRPRNGRMIEITATADDPRIEISGGELSWAQMLLSKFPSFDPGWPDEVKAKWFDAFDKLMKQEPKKEAP